MSPPPTPRLRGRAGQAQRARRLKRSNGLCQRCLPLGRVRLAIVVDHIVPLTKGGPDTDGNTRNLCDDCHQVVTAEQFGTRLKPEIGLDGWPLEDR